MIGLEFQQSNLSKMKKNKLQKNFSFSLSGFSLVEVLITFTLFALLIGVVVNSLLVVFRSHRYIFSSLEAQANLRFVLETMTREIKEGSNLNFNPATKTLSFVNKEGQQVEYFLSQEKIFRRQGAELLPVTAETLKIIKFDVAGCWRSSNCQPSVTLLFQIRSRLGTQEAPFYLQTTITQRRIGI